MLKFGMALLECVGAVGEGACVVDVAEATAAETSVGAAVGISAVTKAGASSRTFMTVSPGCMPSEFPCETALATP
ncbi:MAG: hypothetical protein WA633_10530 [Stellaceae bacterium]